MSKQRIRMKVTENRKLTDGIFSMELECPEGASFGKIRPGQFVGVCCRDGSRILPRPISICGFDEEGRKIRLVYRCAGKGTAEFSEWKAGTEADILGILGNGYDLSVLTGRKVLLIGGGIGAPPLLGLAKSLKAANEAAGCGRNTVPAENAGSVSEDDVQGKGSVTAVLGYRTNDLFLADEFRGTADVIIATDDGTAGIHGNVIDAVRAADPEYDVICACGPLPMLRGVKALAAEKGIPAYISLEERMACGVGVCLGCVTKTAAVDEHSHVNNTRICTEGPVFSAEEVLL